MGRSRREVEQYAEYNTIKIPKWSVGSNPSDHFCDNEEYDDGRRAHGTAKTLVICQRRKDAEQDSQSISHLSVNSRELAEGRLTNFPFSRMKHGINP